MVGEARFFEHVHCNHMLQHLTTPQSNSSTVAMYGAASSKAGKTRTHLSRSSMIVIGPQVVVHAHTTPHPTPSVSTMTALSKLTKAQLLDHVSDLNDMLNRAELELASQRPVPVGERLAAVRNEAIALVRDVYRFGAWCRKGFHQILDELTTLPLK